MYISKKYNTKFNKYKKTDLGKIAAYSFLTFWAVIIIIPFFWLVVSSLKDMGQYYSTDLKTVWFPYPLHFENFYHAITMVPLLKFIRNSFMLASMQTMLSVFSSALVAYGLSRFEFKGRDVLFLIIVATMMLPLQVTQIPLFLFFSKIGWVNSFKPLVVPSLFGASWNIFLIRQFMLTLPKELDEAALIDGCNSFAIFTKIILPQSTPALFVAGLFTFLWSWKDLWGPLIYLSNKEFYTLPLGLLFFESPTNVQYTVQLAAIVIALIPTIIIYMFGHRYLEKGINIAEVK